LTRIVVLLKDIVDLTEMKIDPSTRQPRTEGVKRRISELDERALEAAIQLKERGGGEIVALSMGGGKTRTALLKALAMGADSAYIVNDDGLAGVDALTTSKVLKAALEKIGDYDLILCGEMTLDSAVRDLEDVDEVVGVGMPAVISVVREINEPRIPSLMNIMKAKRKPMEEWDATALGLSADELRAGSSVEVLKVEAPKVERKRVVIEAETVEEAAAKLAEAIVAEGVLEG